MPYLPKFYLNPQTRDKVLVTALGIIGGITVAALVPYFLDEVDKIVSEITRQYYISPGDTTSIDQTILRFILGFK